MNMKNPSDPTCPCAGRRWQPTRIQLDLIGCLINGVVAALPAFLTAFLNCLGGGDGTAADDKYQPGNRDRCQ